MLFFISSLLWGEYFLSRILVFQLLIFFSKRKCQSLFQVCFAAPVRGFQEEQGWRHGEETKRAGAEAHSDKQLVILKVQIEPFCGEPRGKGRVEKGQRFYFRVELRCSLFSCPDLQNRRGKLKVNDLKPTLLREDNFPFTLMFCFREREGVCE